MVAIVLVHRVREVSAVAHDVSGRLVGDQDAAGRRFRDNQPDGHPPDDGCEMATFRRQISIETRGFQGDGCLRGDHLQGRDAIGAEGSRSQTVFQVQDARQVRLLEQRQAEHGARVLPPKVVVIREQGRQGRVVQQHAFTGPHHVSKHRLGQLAGFDGRATDLDLMTVRSHRCLGLDRIAAVRSRKDQQNPIGARLLQDQSQQRLDQLVELDFAGKSLERLDHVRQIDLRQPGAERGGQAGASGLFDLGEFTVEESDLRRGAPPHVTGPRLPQMCVGVSGQVLV